MKKLSQDIRNISFNKKKYYKKRKYSKWLLIVMLVGIVLMILKLQKLMPTMEQYNKNVKVTSEQKIRLNSESEKDKQNKDEQNDKKIEEDLENYEDVATVYENTAGLLKGEKKYPVRTDGKKVVYLTFDDGPSTTNTPEVIKILDRYGIKATFFVAGYAIDSNDESKAILKQLAEDGQSIGNHTYSHNYSYLYPGRVVSINNFISDINKCNQAIKNVLGQDYNVRMVRFPGGYWSWEGRTPIKTELDNMGIYEIDWNAINGDAENNNSTAEQLLEKTKYYTEILGPEADSIVLLMHDTYGKEETVKALPNIIEYYKSKGFVFKAMR